MSPSLSLLVIRCSDLDVSKRFYEAIGLVLVPERHQSGPEHWSCQVGETVLELYPAGAAPVAPLRLGFQVADVRSAVDAALANGGGLSGSFDAARTVVVDPDGNRIELTPSPIRTSPVREAKTSRTRFEHAAPILKVADLARSVRYYVDVLGFTNAEWGGDDFTCVSRDGASIYLSRGDQGHAGTWVWIGVEDVEALHDEYSRSGATILQPPETLPWACEMKVADPDGHVLRFGSDPKVE